MENKGGQYVTVGVIAQIYGVDERSVQYWAKDIPGIEKNGKGLYSLLSVVRSVYTWQRGLIDRNGGESLEEKRKDLIDRDIKLKDIEIAKEEKKLIDKEIALANLKALSKETMTAIFNTVPRLRKKLAIEQDYLKCAELLEKEFNNVAGNVKKGVEAFDKQHT